MKLGPLAIQVEVSRDPCSCGAAPVKATVPVQVGMIPMGLRDASAAACVLDVSLAIDTAQAERDATVALACKRCEA